MEIYSFDELSSTQLWLSDRIRNGALRAPVAVVAKRQSDGIGSRGNRWDECDEALTFSFAVGQDSLPSDLPIVSASIFFGYIFKEVLEARGSKVWLKWPNDLYLGDKKLGGVITSKIGEILICGIGINLSNGKETYAVLEPEISRDRLLEEYLKKAEAEKSWKRIFSKYKVEFELSLDFGFHHNGAVVSASSAVLCSDGALLIDGERVYSAR